MQFIAVIDFSIRCGIVNIRSQCHWYKKNQIQPGVFSRNYEHGKNTVNKLQTRG